MDCVMFDGGYFVVCAQATVLAGSWMGQSSGGFWSHKWKADMNSNGDTDILFAIHVNTAYFKPAVQFHNTIFCSFWLL